jgi:hypothetical protein
VNIHKGSIELKVKAGWHGDPGNEWLYRNSYDSHVFLLFFFPSVLGFLLSSGYPDPLVRGPAKYHQRLAELIALVSDTIRAESRSTRTLHHSITKN